MASGHHHETIDEAPGAGEIRFSYLQDLEDVEDEFIPPRRSRFTNSPEEAGLMWLFDIAD